MYMTRNHEAVVTASTVCDRRRVQNWCCVYQAGRRRILQNNKLREHVTNEGGQRDQGRPYTPCARFKNYSKVSIRCCYIHQWYWPNGCTSFH